jgi:hypothetical protein
VSEFTYKVTDDDEAERCLELLDDEKQTNRWVFRRVLRAVRFAINKGMKPGFVHLHPLRFDQFWKEATRVVREESEKHGRIHGYVKAGSEVGVVVDMFGQRIYVEGMSCADKDDVIVVTAEGERVDVQGF